MPIMQNICGNYTNPPPLSSGLAALWIPQIAPLQVFLEDKHIPNHLTALNLSGRPEVMAVHFYWNSIS